MVGPHDFLSVGVSWKRGCRVQGDVKVSQSVWNPNIQDEEIMKLMLKNMNP